MQEGEKMEEGLEAADDSTSRYWPPRTLSTRAQKGLALTLHARPSRRHSTLRVPTSQRAGSEVVEQRALTIRQQISRSMVLPDGAARAGGE